MKTSPATLMFTFAAGHRKRLVCEEAGWYLTKSVTVPQFSADFTDLH